MLNVKPVTVPELLRDLKRPFALNVEEADRFIHLKGLPSAPLTVYTLVTDAEEADR